MKRVISDSTLFFVILSILSLSYFPQLINNELLGDDIWRIAELSGISFSQIFKTELADRPLLISSIWLEHNILQLPFGALRFINLILLSLISVLLRKIAVLFLSLNKETPRDSFLCILVLIFSLHPLHTQVVGHIVQRGILIAGLCSILATYFLLKSNFEVKSRYWPYALILWILALLSKPNVVFFLGFWLLLLLFFYEKKKIKSLIPFFLACLIPIGYYKLGGFNSQESEGFISSFDYFLVQGKVIPIYLKLILLPFGLKFNHDIVIHTESPFYLGLIFWFLFLSVNIAIVYFIKNRILKITLLTLSLSFLPESSFFPIIHTIFEHRTFFPILFLSLSLMIVRWPAGKLLNFVGIGVICIYASLSFLRSYQVRDFDSWAKEEVSHTCNLSYLSFYLTGQFFQRNDIDAVNLALESLNKCPEPNSALIQSITSLKDLYSKDKVSLTDLDELKLIIHSDNIVTPPIRSVFNQIVHHKLSSLMDKSFTACLMEDFGSVQLKAARLNPRAYKSFIRSYNKSSSDCLATKLFQDEDPYRRHRIRSIRVAYYGEQDNSLRRDLESMKADDRYSELLELINNGPYFK